MYTFRIFMKCTNVCAAYNLSILHQIINKPEFSCLADKIAEQRPDMNIKVTAFTESKKLYYTLIHCFSVIMHCTR